MSKRLVIERQPTLKTKLDYYLVVSQEWFELTKFLIDQMQTFEVQWYSVIEPDYSQQANGKIFYKVSEILIPAQTVSSKTVESEPLEIAQMYQEAAKQRSLTGDDKLKFISSVGAWCHSHVQMEAKPSGTDEDNWEALIGKATTPKAMIILNQQGSIYCRIFDPNLDSLIIEQPSVVVDSIFDYAQIIESLSQDKIKKKTTITTVTSTPSTTSPTTSTGSITTSTTHTPPTKATEYVFHYLGKR